MEEFNLKLNALKLPIGLSLVGMVLLTGGLFSSELIQKPEPKTEFPKESIVSRSNLEDIKIDVSGAVNNPGVFTISKNSHAHPPDARIEDAIKMAGGFSENANKEYVAKQLNLSQKLTDGLKLYIPFEGEKLTGGGGAGSGAAAGAAASAAGKIGINSADQASLESLSGVGPATAKKIIDGRPYAAIEDLLNKKVVSKAVYGKIKDFVDLN